MINSGIYAGTTSKGVGYIELKRHLCEELRKECERIKNITPKILAEVTCSISGNEGGIICLDRRGR